MVFVTPAPCLCTVTALIVKRSTPARSQKRVGRHKANLIKPMAQVVTSGMQAIALFPVYVVALIAAVAIPLLI